MRRNSQFRQSFLMLVSAALIAGLLVAQGPFPGHAALDGNSSISPAANQGPSLTTGQPHISSEQAIARALNDFEVHPGKVTLRHPNHVVSFTDQGVQFTPRRGGPSWEWQLTHVEVGDAPLAGVELGEVSPLNQSLGVVSYPRGLLLEQYLARPNSLEQQFVLPEPLSLEGEDLVIVGRVRSQGAFENTAEGWLWHTPEGGVALSDVWVGDADGVEIPARMAVTAEQTRIIVDGVALAQAAYPVTIDPEIGANDFRLSDMGGDETYDATCAAVAYNSADDEYLVVWDGDDNTGGLVDGEYEVFGQRVSAVTGAQIGKDFRLSDMGPDGDPDYDANNPAVAYNSADNQYLVVWEGDDDTAMLVDGEYEVFGQRVDAATGAEIGANDFRISDMGGTGDPDYDAREPAVVYNSAANQYLVVWYGDDDTGVLVDNEHEIFGQRVNAATGAQIGLDLRLSDMGPNGDSAFGAYFPAVAYNSTDNEYLVVWHGDDDTAVLVDNEFEIFGQRLDATGAGVGANDFRISDMGGTGDPDYDANYPAVTYNSAANEYLAVWEGDENTGGLVDGELEIFMQRLDAATGTAVGANDFRLSDMGSDGDTDYDARIPTVTYNSMDDEYLVAWYGDDDTGGLVNMEYEIFSQRVDGTTGAQIGTDFRLSDMGGTGNTIFSASYPAVVYNSAEDQYLVVWHGDDNVGRLVDQEFEIFGQRVDAATGAELGPDFHLSDMGGDKTYDATRATVAYNSANKQYLVVWGGDDNTGGLVDGEYEVFGQRVNAVTGVQIGKDFRLSDMGPDGDPDYDANCPAVAYNNADNQYLVVWRGDDNTGGLVDEEFEIFGQRVHGTTGAEIGPDFRLSEMGGTGDPDYDAHYPAVAYNSTDNQYLVVWYGDDDTGVLVDNEHEIFGQRVNAATGAQIGLDLRLSDMGPNGDSAFGAFYPAVAYNNTDNEYLAVWYGDDDTAGLVDEEFEIFGQRLDAATGTTLGANDFRFSDMGGTGDPAYDAYNPAIAYSSAANEYLVVWQGDDDIAGLVDGEYEIFGQRLDAVAGTVVGDNDFRLSDMGGTGNPGYGAYSPAVVYNSADDEYLVVWYGDDDTTGLVDGEYEIFGQRLDATTGTAVGANDFRISDMGGTGDLTYAAFSPGVTYDSTDDEYLVVWEGDDNTGGLVDDEFEIFGQRLETVREFKVYLPLTLRQ